VVFLLEDNDYSFPPVELADSNGLLAAGGDLNWRRLLEAYIHGIFPWFNDDEIPLWWSPDPRWVFYTDQIHISKSMKRFLNKKPYEISKNKAFREVMMHCSSANDRAKSGTWISNMVIDAYTQLHENNYASSIEVWDNEELVGGIYGVDLMPFFFGESMFSLKPNASKYALIMLAEELRKKGYIMIDCQLHNAHLESMGAVPIDRQMFITLLWKHLHQLHV